MPLDRHLTALAPETPEDLSDLEELRTLVTVCRTHRRDIGERQIFVRIETAQVALRFGQSFAQSSRAVISFGRSARSSGGGHVHVEAGEHLGSCSSTRADHTFGIAALRGRRCF